jgi:hypothetical protein
MALTDLQHARIALLQTDLAAGLRAILSGLGCDLPSDVEPWTVCLAFSNYQLRRVPVAPRRVHRSDTLSAQPDLAPEERVAIDTIEARFVTGEDIYPHQSTGLLKPLSLDGMHADWGLHHLHLGMVGGRPAPAPFVNRSKKVLIVRITAEDAYFIAAVPHGAGAPAPWWENDLVEIVHRNWRETIAEYEVEDYRPKLSPEDHRRLRPGKSGAGCNFTTAVTTSDGTSYRFSSGIVAAGYSGEAVGMANDLMNGLTRFVQANEGDFRLVVTGDHRRLELAVLRQLASTSALPTRECDG